MNIGRPRRSRSVGLDYKSHRLVTSKRPQDDFAIEKNRTRFVGAKKPFSKDLCRIAKYFEEMLTVFDGPMFAETKEKCEPEEVVELSPGELEFVNDFQAKIIKESLDCGLSQEIPTLKELERMISGGKQILKLEERMSDALEHEKSQNKKLEEMMDNEAEFRGKAEYFEECLELVENLVDESSSPILKAIAEREELLSLAKKRASEIFGHIEKLSKMDI